MRRCRTALAALTIMLMSLLAAGPASAGGPTSVLLVAPGTGKTASLYTGDADYEALAGMVGAFQAPEAAGTVDPSGASHDSGTAVTLTWLIHDVEVWRVDRVYFGADGGPWIATQSVAGSSGNVRDSPLSWHTPARGKELVALLERLGVSPDPRGDGNAPVPGGDSLGGDAATDTAPPAATDTAPPAATAAAGLENPTLQRTDRETPSSAGLWWGLAGVPLGVALSIAGMLFFPKFRTARSHHPHEPDSGPNCALNDELSSHPQRR